MALPQLDDSYIVFAIMAALFVLLVWGRWRYDLVAFTALIVAVVVGVVPGDQAFAGFGHPAVVIIALVLIISRGLSNAGVVDVVVRHFVDAGRSITAHISIMSTVAASLSAVMNNVGALALLMPVDLQAAAKAKRSPALTLMPLSFATILGGLVTLIGTPPNIIIAAYREDALGAPFAMFDFAPVGLACAVAGVLFIALVGWRLIPQDRAKKDTPQELFELEGYIAEARVPEGAKIIGQKVRSLHPEADEKEVAILGLIRAGRRLPGFARREVLREGDILVFEARPDAIDKFIASTGLEYVGAGQIFSDKQGSGDLGLMEVVVPAGARIDGRSARELNLLQRQSVLLLGVSRQGQRFRDRVRRLTVRAGDILLLLGPTERLTPATNWLGCLPLAERGLQVTRDGKALLAAGMFAGAIGLASFGLLYLPIALAAVVVGMVLTNIISLREIYDQVEWPIIVLLGALIPLGQALEATGGTQAIVNLLLELAAGAGPVILLSLLMVLTMTLSDVLNNTATAVIAAPIALQLAERLDANPDAFLMGVAVSASCAFLTPIGHKNNTLIMGPGGYRFGDYWRMGLPVELIVLLVSIPMILLVWPL